jgi:hypothetical protein
MLVGICGGMWVLAVAADSHGIPSNTNLEPRSQHTPASLHGWYVAQRVAFHVAAIVTVACVRRTVMSI